MEKKGQAKLPEIETELKNLWKSHSNANKIKACLFNLIVYTHDPKRASYFKQIVQMIMDTFPCRVIFIQGNREIKDPYLRVHVYTGSGSSYHQGMLCDKIIIEAAGPRLAEVPFLILPHLIPDLPIYLLWGQDPTKDGTILPYLQKFATRLIFDSECTENLHRFSQMMLNRLESSKNEIVDLNWTRIGGWREVITQTFDTQERIEQLAACRTIKIAYNSLTELSFFHPETQALYLQAWLAAQLEWEYERMERKDKILMYYRFQGHPIQIILQPQKREDLEPEEIVAMEISGKENYLCTLERRTDTQVTVHCSTQYQCQLPFTLVLSNIRSGRAFMQEVIYQRPSDQYNRMLRLISRIE
jgi:glucose-6-phosphate dehydrogenase assembly protein OpcA